MEVLCYGYQVPFHHLPLKLQEPVEYLLLQLGVCGNSGSSKISGHGQVAEE